MDDEPADYEPDRAFMTMTFPSSTFIQHKGNPFQVDTPWGRPVVIGIGNAFDETEHLINELNKREEA